MVEKRIIIKFSGEVMATGHMEANLDFQKIYQLARSLKKLVAVGYEVGVVLGGGNIFRGRLVKNMAISRVPADYMGMLATAINALALQSVLHKLGQKTHVLSPLSLPQIMEHYSPAKAKRLLSQKRVVIFACGTGKPYVTTDTALALRATEVGAKHIYKATNVNGVYSANPDKYPHAKFYKKLSYQEALDKKLQVMDLSAFTMALKNNLVLTVFKYSPSNLYRVVTGVSLGTKVSKDGL